MYREFDLVNIKERVSVKVSILAEESHLNRIFSEKNRHKMLNSE